MLIITKGGVENITPKERMNSFLKAFLVFEYPMSVDTVKRRDNIEEFALFSRGK